MLSASPISFSIVSSGEAPRFAARLFRVVLLRVTVLPVAMFFSVDLIIIGFVAAHRRLS